MVNDGNIQRILRSTNVTGRKIAEALQNLASKSNATYVQNSLPDIDGKQNYILGIYNIYYNNAFMIRTGKDLENNRIELDKTYAIVGIIATKLFDTESYVSNTRRPYILFGMDKISYGLEELLRK
ncbi:MAG: hypothetical protein ACP5N1_00110 [Candidatus Woesearchaeota archaeon]